MKIFMCVNYPIYNPAIGISKKIRSQIDNFEKLGFEVTYSAYTQNSITIYNGNNLVIEKKRPSIIPAKIYSLIRKFYWLKVVKKHLSNNDEYYDIGFIRWGAVDSSFLKTLNIMDKKCEKIIMDCHGYHTNYRGKTLKSFYIEKTTKKNGHLLHKYVDICLTETKNRMLFDIPAIPMDTGIDVDKYVPHHYDGRKDEIHMVSVANESSYHGYDRIIRGLACYKGNNVYLHLVGKMSEATKKMVRNLYMADRIFLHGYKTGKELDEIYLHSNIGVGPLAPHRIGGKEGTGIKTKEYFAIGLPYFFAGQELLVPDDFPYVLKFDADDSPIDVRRIVSFYNTIKNDNRIESVMRDFARENYSWEKVFIKALKALGVKGF